MPRPDEAWAGTVADTPDDSMPVLGREAAFTGRVWSVVRDRVSIAGQESVRDVQIHPGAVAVIALDDDDNVLLIRQYRHPVAMYLFEPPAGLLDVAGEPALATAKRELAEEAGLAAATWNVLVDVFNSPGGSSEAIRVYLARDLRALTEGRLHTGEAEEAHLPQAWVPLAEAVSLVMTGKIGSPSAVAGILALQVAYSGDLGGLGELRPADSPWEPRRWLESAGRVSLAEGSGEISRDA